MKPVLLLQTGDVPAEIPCAENFDAMFKGMVDFGPGGAAVIHAPTTSLPANAGAYRGIIVTGSPAMVSDREPWSERCAIWLRHVAESGMPILGVCYGHQLLAHAFGGRVGFHPQGMELGTHVIHLLPEAADHPWLNGLPSIFLANLAHSQSVLDVPEGATVLARSDHDKHQILAYGDNVLTVQFHPEFSQVFMEAYVKGITGQDGFDPSTVRLGLPVRETPVPASLMQRFVNATS